ncbi:MAG: ribonuclease HII [Rhodospirillales bacterium]|nr:ribonuclease HII [Rhodospirillales bacterium]
MPDFFFEDQARSKGYKLVAGVDEAGRGPWCGPVVAGAAILDPQNIPQELLEGLDDSKKLKPAKRELLFEVLLNHAITGVGQASAEEIDEMNILAATMLAMKRAVEDLGTKIDYALIDGNKAPNLSCPAEAVVKGDGRSLSIAAASIVAKVTRDRIMTGLAEEYPQYGWETNSGYGTKVHQEALRKHGVTPHHRRSYKPIAYILSLK